MIELYAAWVKKYPIVSIEDGLAENDWAGGRGEVGRSKGGAFGPEIVAKY